MNARDLIKLLYWLRDDLEWAVSGPDVGVIQRRIEVLHGEIDYIVSVLRRRVSD